MTFDNCLHRGRPSPIVFPNGPSVKQERCVMLHVCSSDVYGTPYYKALVHGATCKVCHRPSELLLPFEI